NSYLFPTSNIQDHAIVVNEGVKNLHHDGYSYLLKKLIESLDNANEQIKLNAKRYLLGLSFKPLNNDVLEQIKKHFLVECSSDESKRQCLMECISTNGNLLKGMEDIVYLRLNKMFEDTISTTKSSDQHTYLRHPVQIAISVLGLEREIIDRCFRSSIDDVLEKYKLSPVLMKNIKGHEWARQKVIQSIFGQAGSTTFSEANTFAQSVNSYDGDISSLMDNINCFELIVHICAAGNWGSFGAEGMMKGKFNNIPKIKEKAVKALQDNISNCQEIIARINPALCEAKDFEERYL
ncbi:hypothetical protein L7502_004969, partial [Escherichia coli]|nr:hypothetical protein [Escherichia coli]